jgi:ATP-dependent phosphoenolpyruvate carboxykinase
VHPEDPDLKASCGSGRAQHLRRSRAYDAQARKLASMFVENFKQIELEVSYWHQKTINIVL